MLKKSLLAFVSVVLFASNSSLAVSLDDFDADGEKLAVSEEITKDDNRVEKDKSERKWYKRDHYIYAPPENAYPNTLNSVDSAKGNDIPMQPLKDEVFEATRHSVDGKKLNLNAIIFDPKADFSLNATNEGREMLPMEEWQYDIHKALHAEVKATSALSRRPLLRDYLTKEFEHGPLKDITVWTAYRGNLQNLWAGEAYMNTLYSNNLMFSVLEGTFKNGKTSFRSMWLWTPGKDGHDFFNDAVGDQYIMHKITKNDQFLIGYSRNTNGIEGGASGLVIPFFARSQIASAYGNARALGLKFQGKHKYYDYNVGGFSSGRAFYDWFPGVEFAGSFGVKPLGAFNGKYGNLLLGGSLNAGSAKYHYTVANTYLDYEYRRWNLTLEYGSADGSNGSKGITKNKSEGYNATIGYRISPKLQALFRYDVFDPNKDKANDIRKEYTVGLNYFIKEQALRLMVNYTMYNVENGTYGSRIYTGLQVIL